MQTDTVSEMVSAKARRFLDQGRVSWVRGHVYWVQGDSGEYIAHVGNAAEAQGACTCPAKRGCSHIIAASAYELANPVPVVKDDSDPFEGIN